MYRLSFLARCAALLVLTLPGVAAELRLDGDRMFLRARHESLRDVLGDFVRVGVEVRVEPGIDATVHGLLEDTGIVEGLNTLLESFNYVLYWERLDGPAGPLVRLSSVHVFRPGHQADVVPFDPVGDNLHVVRRPGVPAHAKDEILLGVRPGTSAKQFRELLASIGGTVVASVPEFGVYQVRLPRDSNVPAIAAGLGGNPYVAVAEPNYVQEVTAPSPVASTAATPAAGNALPAEPGSSAVAVFDSGLLALDQLDGVVAGAYDSIQPGREMTDPLGHGTQMALIASGAVLPGGGVNIGDGTPILAVRSFDDDGQASNFSLLRGIDYTIEQGGRVMSLSWGTETDSEFLAHAVGYAQERDIVVVASAGNEPTGQPVYPAAYQGVVAVAAMMPDGSIWSQSNYGSFLTAAAPGTGEFPVGYNGPPGTYAGTSIASPYIARAFGQYFDLNPTATAAQAMTAFTSSLTDAGDPGKDPHYGYGAFDQAAVSKFLQTAPTQ